MRKLIAERPLLVLALMALVVFGLGHRALFITQDNSPEVFFAADEESRATYERFERTFGADEVVLVDLRGVSHLREADLLVLAKLTRELKALPGVSSTISVARIFDSGEGELPRKLDRQTMADVAYEVREVGLYRELALVRPEARAMSVMTTLAVETGDPTSRTRIVSEIQAIADRYRQNSEAVFVAGLAPTHAAFDRLTQQSLLIFMPLVTLVSLIVGLALFRSLRALVAMFAPALASVLLGIAGLELAGQSLNLVTAMLPPLVMTIGFASAIHLVTHYGNVLARGLEPAEATLQALSEKRFPLAFSILTTAVGFGSLALSPVSSVRTLGISSFATLLMTLLLVVVGTPTLLVLLAPRIHAPAHRRQILENLAIIALRHRLITIVIVALVAAAVVSGVTRLRPSINGVRMLAQDSNERLAYEQLEREGLGLANLEVWIRTEVCNPEALHDERPRLKRLTSRVGEIDGVTGTFSAADLLDAADLRLYRSRARGMSRREALAVSDGTGKRFDLLQRMWTSHGGLRLTVLMQTADTPQEIERQQQEILAAARAVYPDSPIEITGHYALLISTPGALMETLISSLSITLVIVFGLFLLSFRSLGLVLAAMTANMLPVALVLGMMGWLGVSLDVATIMTGSVVFGLAVDDTFHYLYHRRASGCLRQAAVIAGQGIVATTAVVVIGFSTFGLSGFVPVRSFGLLTGFGVLAALGIDALLLPALVGDEDKRSATI